MIDVGTGHGSTFEPFAEFGWQVYGFEPDPSNREVAQRLALHFPNVLFDNRAVTDSIKENVPFYRSTVSAGISGLSQFDESHRRAGTVCTTTLSAFCDEHHIDHIDYLKIDTEGYDFFVLKGAPWEKFQPCVIMCEFEDQKTIPLGYSCEEMANFLVRKGYKILVSEWHPVVKRGGPHKWRRFVQYPDDSLKNAAWGNVIAVLGGEQFKLMLHCASKSTPRWKMGNLIWKCWGLLSSHG